MKLTDLYISFLLMFAIMAGMFVLEMEMHKHIQTVGIYDVK